MNACHVISDMTASGAGESKLGAEPNLTTIVSVVGASGNLQETVLDARGLNTSPASLYTGSVTAFQPEGPCELYSLGLGAQRQSIIAADNERHRLEGPRVRTIAQRTVNSLNQLARLHPNARGRNEPSANRVLLT